ncbi:MAG: Chromosomal replication initiator protein DnaA, partial [uncultured Nocardioides sp.]
SSAARRARARARARRRAAILGARDPAQPEVHVRDLRHRIEQPLPPRGRRGRRRGTGQGLQPAPRLRRVRPRQDPPAPRDRPLRAQPLQQRQGALRLQRGVHQRVHQRDPRRPAGPVQAPLPRRRRAAHRRHPVPGGEDPDPGGVLPHLQHAPQRQQADRADLRPRAEAARGARGPAAQPVRVGPDHRRPAPGPRDPHRDPAQEGRDGPAHRTAGRPRVHRLQDPDQHPRARGSADPGHGLRQPQPPGGRHDPGRDRPQGPDPRGRRARDHPCADHRADRGVLRDLDRGPHRALPRPSPRHGAPDRDVPLPGAHRPLPAQDRRPVRQPRPHDGDVRRPQDQPAAPGAPRGVQPGERADQPHQDAGSPGV